MSNAKISFHVRILLSFVFHFVLPILWSMANLHCTEHIVWRLLRSAERQQFGCVAKHSEAQFVPKTFYSFIGVWNGFSMRLDSGWGRSFEKIKSDWIERNEGLKLFSIQKRREEKRQQKKQFEIHFRSAHKFRFVERMVGVIELQQQNGDGISRIKTKNVETE